MLIDDLQAASLQALKAKDEVRLNTLRLVLSQLKNRAIDKRSDLTNDEVVTLLRKEVKKRQDSISLFQAGNRPELAAAEAAEITII